MGGGHVKGSMESQNYGLQSHRLHTIPVIFGAEVVLPEEIKHQSLCTTMEAPSCPTKLRKKTCRNQKGIKQ
jgi:hypothetical protein